jgi:parvulin-like peptidyl-prolyl isomerase
MTDPRFYFRLSCRRFAAALLIILTAAVGANAAGTVVAIVNGDSISTDALANELTRIHNSQMGGATHGEFSLDRLLQRQINNLLIAQEAQTIGLAEDSELVQQVRNFREGLAYRALLKEIVPDSVPVSDDEIRAGFRDNFRRFRVSFATVIDSALAFALRDSLRAGTSFGEIVQRHSIDRFKDKNGDAGLFALIDLPVDLQTPIRSATVGDILDPYYTERVWVIGRVDQELAADSTVYDSVATGLRGFLQERKRQAIRAGYVDGLRSQIPITIDSVAVDSILDQMQAGLPTPDRVAARIGDAQVVRAPDLRNKYIHRISRDPSPYVREILYATLNEQIETALLKAAAARLDYATQARFAVPVKAMRDSLLVARYLNDVIAPAVTVPDSEVNAVYQANLSIYRAPDRIKIATITHSTADSTEADYQKIKAGADFAWIARQSSADEWRVAGGAHDWMAVNQFPQVLAVPLDTAKIGTVLPPVSLQEGEIIFKLLDRERGATLPLDRVESQIRAKLMQRAQLAAIDNAMRELRNSADVRIFDEALNSLRISAPQTPLDDDKAPAESHGKTQP